MIFNSRKLRKVLFSTLLAAGMGVSSANAAGKDNVFNTLGTLSVELVNSGVKGVEYGAYILLGIKLTDSLSSNFGLVSEDNRNIAIEKCKSVLSEVPGPVKSYGDMLLDKAMWAREYKEGKIVDNQFNKNFADIGKVGAVGAVAHYAGDFVDGVRGAGKDKETVVIEKVIVPQQQPAPQFYGNQPYGPNGIMM